MRVPCRIDRELRERCTRNSSARRSPEPTKLACHRGRAPTGRPENRIRLPRIDFGTNNCLRSRLRYSRVRARISDGADIVGAPGASRALRRTRRTKKAAPQTLARRTRECSQILLDDGWRPRSCLAARDFPVLSCLESDCGTQSAAICGKGEVLRTPTRAPVIDVTPSGTAVEDRDGRRRNTTRAPLDGCTSRRPLPAPFQPFIQSRALSPERGVGTMTRVHPGFIG